MTKLLGQVTFEVSPEAEVLIPDPIEGMYFEVFREFAHLHDGVREGNDKVTVKAYLFPLMEIVDEHERDSED